MEDDEHLKEDLKIGTLTILILLAALILCGIGGFILHSIGVIGNTVVEREVFEASYQRSESLKSQIATEEANIAELERKLTNPNLDADTRANLEAQMSAARIRLQTARNKQ